MRPAAGDSYAHCMTDLSPAPTRRSLDWPLILSLAAMPLLQTLFSVTGWAEALGRPQTPLLIALVITVAWVLVVGWSRTRRPILTLLLAALIAAVLTTALGLLVPAARSGDYGNLSDGWGVSAALVVTSGLYAVWGSLAGVMSAGVQRLRGTRARQA